VELFFKEIHEKFEFLRLYMLNLASDAYIFDLNSMCKMRMNEAISANNAYLDLFCITMFAPIKHIYKE